MFGKDTQREATELVVLSLLADAPKYGYLLSKEAAARSEGRIRLTPGVLYPLLKGLEADGLINSSWEEVKADRAEPDADGRRRKWYRLSAKGRRTLEKRAEAHRAHMALLAAFLGENTRAEGAA